MSTFHAYLGIGPILLPVSSSLAYLSILGADQTRIPRTTYSRPCSSALLIHQDLPALDGPAVALCTNFARILSVPDLGATAPRAGSPTPVEPETRAVPADHGFGLDEDENIGPAEPTAVEYVQNRRSKEFKVGRGRFRLSTATCCRRRGLRGRCGTDCGRRRGGQTGWRE
jgi:hypothetical protein